MKSNYIKRGVRRVRKTPTGDMRIYHRFTSKPKRERKPKRTNSLPEGSKNGRFKATKKSQKSKIKPPKQRRESCTHDMKKENHYDYKRGQPCDK